MSNVFSSVDSTTHVGLVIGFEHLVVLIQVLITVLPNQCPSSVQQLVALEKFEAFQVNIASAQERYMRERVKQAQASDAS